MDAVNRRHARLLEMRRHGFIRRQHEFLDDAVRDVARAARDAGHDAGFVEFDQRLGQVEIDRSAPVAFALQDLRQFAHQLETFDQRRIAIPLRGVAFEQQMNVRIGHALGAADHAAAELERHRIALPVDFDERGNAPAGRHGAPANTGSVESSNGSIGTARSGK